MKKLIIAIFVVAFTSSALAASEAKLGEDQTPPKKVEAGGCEFARTAKKKVDPQTSSKTETIKATTTSIKD